MTLDELTSVATQFPPWIKHFAARGSARAGATVVFPHAGGAAVGYRALASALSLAADTFVVQYPQRAERLDEPAAQTVHDLARGLFNAGPWHDVAPLRLFGHSMGAIVAFEFARIAEQHGVELPTLWVSAAPAPSIVATLPQLPTTDSELLADLADLGATDPRLLEDEEFVGLLMPPARGDYQALNRYACGPDIRIRADIQALGGRQDHRVDLASLQQWKVHTKAAFSLSLYDGGHFYITEHIQAVAAQVNADGC
ncbi:Phenyloxazoline synthase MbtB (phenyloxazoline synthetase) [Mycobacterium tuberculosis H37Rv] [Mycobacterium shimoidei]|uniref:Thioesterase TesA n=1 Tax=Mycobacterium shimoidei TaxID=29313 RepID=A0A375Z0E9_MYCSH|nr:thioesterase domain-containing protein [Mycobacterium shimoidei]SRX94673.1 Phenyloxazoline synthase MbtB (phenyloxazoline synthetase) [Mycobacterium tuberculosis H37Rv] [Mycobacterium shimoidei]